MKKLFLGLALMFSLTSCFEDPEIWDSSVVELAGDWNVRTYDSATGDLVADYGQLLTYNTAANNGDMWLDFVTVLKIGGKSKVSTNGLTFNGDDAVSVTGGQVFKNEGRSKTGIETDSIYMEVVKGADTFIVSGHKRTGFQEDEY
ncbi:lipid-binding protein [Sediminitomix flava]|uniref:Lipid-binding putative hydrolase n=1 Tax=Sediminitomix flava TaxID=379075 RepID=A0A315ZA75_SEDFL|nr:lipid-binding protein [Sediminitomix flava]PWJ40980.1 lipid-binding putative hydrolase [Sediminitomix flava]